MKTMRKIVLLVLVNSIATLSFLGFSISVSAGDHVMVRCEGMREEPGSCSKAGCSVKSSGSKMMTLEECERAGGRPIEVEKMD